MALPLRADFSAVYAELEEAESLLMPADLPPEFVDSLLSSLEAGFEFSGQEYDTTGRTGDLLLRFQLPQRFRELVAALRAGEVQRNILIERLP